jgi:general secretion pathway protein E
MAQHQKARKAAEADGGAAILLGQVGHPVAELFQERGGLSEAHLAECRKIEFETGQSLDRIVISKGYLAEEKALALLAEHLGYEFRGALEGTVVPTDFVAQIPVQFARSYTLVALEMGDDVARVLTSAPFDVHPMDDLATMLGLEIEPVLAPRQEITALINRAYRHKADGVDEALEEVEEVGDILGLTAEIEESEDVLDSANKAPIIKLVNTILFQALKLRASDIHFHPYADRLQVRYRIDGVLYDMETVPKKAQEAIVSRIKVMGKMDIAERRLPQDGRASVRIGEGEVDVRISSIPSSTGERIVLRLLDKSAKLYTLDEIGLEGAHKDTLYHYLNYSHGIILVTGPTGSGKTTTLYGALTRIDSKEKNILTIEDPVEYNLPNVSQVQVAEKKGLTFAAGLRSFLRQDPDVMMVGEIRDKETAGIAIQAALTGHLVFSTLHTNDAPSTITRIVNIGIEPYLVSSSLVLIIAQRLVRRICKNCREQIEPDDTMLTRLEELQLSRDRFPGGKLFSGRGCDECFHSGYAGRTALFEMLPINDAIRRMMMDGSSATDMKRISIESGMKTLRQHGIERILKGETTPTEILRVTQLDVF